MAQYPAASQVLFRAAVSILWKSAGVGTALVVLGFPVYEAWLQYCTGTLQLSHRQAFAVLLVAAHSLPYIFINGFFGACDAFGLLSHYKIGRSEAIRPDARLVRKTLFEAFINQVVTTPPTAYFLYPVFLQCGMSTLDSPVPPASRLFPAFVIAHLVNEFGFYFTHRLLHVKELYSPIHKQHHNYKGSMGIAAEYANPIEAIVSNQIPTVAGIILFGTHPLAIFVWLVLRLRQTYEVHSGYCFQNSWYSATGLAYPEETAHHDCHHSVNKGNFGSELTDWMFGTMDSFVDVGLTSGYVASMHAKATKNAGKSAPTAKKNE